MTTILRSAGWFSKRGIGEQRKASPASRPSGFTLVELLVTITIIGMLAGMMLGALQMAGNAGRDAATKATIAKLNTIIMQRYESYMTRRVPINITGLSRSQAAEVRLGAIRELMRMEMPDRWEDITDNATVGVFTPSRHRPVYTLAGGGALVPYTSNVPEPAIHQLYRNKYAPGGSVSAGHEIDHYNNPKVFFMAVSMGSPEAMEQFNESEIAVDSDGWSYFVDGWGQPIFFLRWAPGCSANHQTTPGVVDGYSSIQSGDATNDHDPFDTQNVDSAGCRLVPLIYSFGRAGAANVNTGTGVSFFDTNTAALPSSICGPQSPYLNVGAPAGIAGASGNITNHLIEQR
jgi:prepilin-type N-terminal cleavage/methylation domain-containing protein